MQVSPTTDDKGAILAAILDAEAVAMRARLRFFCAFVECADNQFLKIVCNARGPWLEPHAPIENITVARRTDTNVIEMLDELNGVPLVTTDEEISSAYARIPDGNLDGWRAFRARAASDESEAHRSLACARVIRGLEPECDEFVKARTGLLSAVHTYNIVRVIALGDRIRGNDAATVGPALRFCLSYATRLRNAVNAAHQRVFGKPKASTRGCVADTVERDRTIALQREHARMLTNIAVNCGALEPNKQIPLD